MRASSEVSISSEKEYATMDGLGQHEAAILNEVI